MESNPIPIMDEQQGAPTVRRISSNVSSSAADISMAMQEHPPVFYSAGGLSSSCCEARAQGSGRGSMSDDQHTGEEQHHGAMKQCCKFV